MRIYDRFAIVVCVQVRPVGGPPFGVLGDGKESKQRSTPSWFRDRVYESRTAAPAAPSGVKERYAMTAFRVKFFTESLILAQDERWRRA